MRNHQLESRVRENRTHGSEGGESVVLFPTPIRVAAGSPVSNAGLGRVAAIVEFSSLRSIESDLIDRAAIPNFGMLDSGIYVFNFRNLR